MGLEQGDIGSWPDSDLPGGPQNGRDWVESGVRRETGKEQMVQVHHDEGVANRIDPESCAVACEGNSDALTRESRLQRRNRKTVTAQKFMTQ